MRQTLAFFLQLFVFVAHLANDGFGLKCKQGQQSQPIGRDYTMANSTCPDKEAKYCVASTCTIAANPNFGTIMWFCYRTQNVEECEEKNNKYGLSCKCHFGEEGQDHGNEQFTLPPPIPIDPSEKVVLCKVGAIAENKRGSVTREICPKEARHCFATSCYKKDDGQLHGVVWGCAQRDNANVCTEFEQNLNAILIKQVSCECLFGARGVDYSNQKMMVHHLFLPPTSSLTTSINAATRTTAATMAPETSTQTMEVITTAKMENDSIENGIVRPAIANLSIVVMLSFAVLVVLCQRIAI